MSPKLLSAVVTAENEDVPVFVSLLSSHLADKVEFIYYTWPKQMDSQQVFDIVVLHDYGLIGEILARFSIPAPTIIHLDQETTRRDYTSAFPHHKVVRIKQATLDRLDYTLQLAAFEGVILDLYGRE